MKSVGIEKINLYGCSLYLDQKKLAAARGLDPQKVVADFLIDTRSLNPLYEDTVTMAANAAGPLLEDEDRQAIGLLVVGTESSVDFGKPISTNIHGALGLPSNVRNFETKHACYSGVAALDSALNWIAAGLNHGRKALVISTDYSRLHLGAKEEFVLGGVASAALVSDTPRVIEYDLQAKGNWTSDVYDTFRPSARHEVGNNEVSLYSYLDALEGSYQDYLSRNGQSLDFDAYFAQSCYHTPFPGMAFQAHRTVCNLARPRSKAEVQESFSAQGPAVPAVRPQGRLHLWGQQFPGHLRHGHGRARPQSRRPRQLFRLRLRSHRRVLQRPAVRGGPRRGRPDGNRQGPGRPPRSERGRIRDHRKDAGSHHRETGLHS